VQPAQCGTGIAAQFVGEAAADPPVVLVGVRLASAPVEGEHGLRGQPFVQRMLGDGDGQRRHQLGVPAEPEQHVVAVELGREPFVEQQAPRRGQPRGVQAGERFPAPQAERLREQFPA